MYGLSTHLDRTRSSTRGSVGTSWHTERDCCATLTRWDVLISCHDSISSSVNTSGSPHSVKAAEFPSMCPGRCQCPRKMGQIPVNCRLCFKKNNGDCCAVHHLPHVSLFTHLRMRYLSLESFQHYCNWNFLSTFHYSHEFDRRIICVLFTPKSQNTLPKATEQWQAARVCVASDWTDQRLSLFCTFMK